MIDVHQWKIRKLIIVVDLLITTSDNDNSKNCVFLLFKNVRRPTQNLINNTLCAFLETLYGTSCPQLNSCNLTPTILDQLQLSITLLSFVDPHNINGIMGAQSKFESPYVVSSIPRFLVQPRLENMVGILKA